MEENGQYLPHINLLLTESAKQSITLSSSMLQRRRINFWQYNSEKIMMTVLTGCYQKIIKSIIKQNHVF